MQAGEFYMVRARLWHDYGAGRRQLCILCFEARLGRCLRKSDFTDCPVNHDYWRRYGYRHPGRQFADTEKEHIEQAALFKRTALVEEVRRQWRRGGRS
jgi:hypothetical protein